MAKRKLATGVACLPQFRVLRAFTAERQNQMTVLPKNQGRLKHGNPGGDPASAPRCDAKTRNGGTCRAPGMLSPKSGLYTRCRMHGGASTAKEMRQTGATMNMKSEVAFGSAVANPALVANATTASNSCTAFVASSMWTCGFSALSLVGRSAGGPPSNVM